MAELFVQIAVSIDGYIEDANKNIDWMEFDTSYDPVVTATLQSIDGIIFRSQGPCLLHRFWPSAASSEGASADLIEQARLMNELPKYVLTHGAETTGWNNSHAIRIEDLPRLKREARRPLALFAGAMAAQAAITHGVVDEIRIFQKPVVQGDGTPMFGAEGQRRDLAVIESQSFASGAVLSRFAVHART